MSASEIPLSQAKTRLSALVNEVAYSHKHFIILSHGKAKARLVPVSEAGDESPVQGLTSGLAEARKLLVKLRRRGLRFDSVADLKGLRSGKVR